MISPVRTGYILVDTCIYIESARMDYLRRGRRFGVVFGVLGAINLICSLVQRDYCLGKRNLYRRFVLCFTGNQMARCVGAQAARRLPHQMGTPRFPACGPRGGWREGHHAQPLKGKCTPAVNDKVVLL